jgi:hypothetical protein
VIQPSVLMPIATQDDLRTVLERLSPEDREELEALGDEADAMAALAMSVRCWCGLVDGIPMLVAGVTANGVAWMMTTPDWRRDRKFYLRATRQIVEEMQALFPVLRTAEGAGRARELRWLKWLGFMLRPPCEISGRMVCLAERTAR